MKELTKIQGEVDSIVFKSEKTGFCVLMLEYDNDLLSVVGDMGDVEEGEELTLTGEFTSHPRYGEQFKVQAFERSLPTTSASILKYLASGSIPEIGPVLAKRLVKEFGDLTLEIIEKEPEKLLKISGITEKKLDKITKAFKSTFAMRLLMVYLNGFQVPTSVSIGAWKRFGELAEATIRSNPYVLSAEGIDLPFAKCDEIAAKLEVPYDSKYRVAAGITAILRQHADQGHTCVPLDKLKPLAFSYLNIGEEVFEAVLKEELEDENLFSYKIGGRKFIMLRDCYKAEDYIARRLEIMRSIVYDNNIDYSEVIDFEEEDNCIEYAEMQRLAINKALSEGFLVLTGGPGTGKTTTLNAIISLFGQQGMNVMIAAPTGRAAKRTADLTGCEVKTIHRLLEVKFQSDGHLAFAHNEDNLLDCDALVIDEMSMVDSCLFAALLKAVSVTCKLILVGDSNQLPSVGAGNVLKDIIDSGVMSVVELKEIFRQARESDIIVNAHKIVRGEEIDLTKKDKDFFFFQRLEYTALQELVVDLSKNRLPAAYGFDPIDSIQVISPTRKGPAGTVKLNEKLQAELNPAQKGKSEIKTLNCIFRKGDKVMQTHNDYDIEWKKELADGTTETGTGIFNGDIGIITAVNKTLRSATIDFEGRVAIYNGDMLDNLELAYAITVHKSQGSEFDAVLLTVFGGYDKLYYRNLLYTAVTRAKKLLIIIGSKNRVDHMIHNNVKNSRWTALKSMLMTKAEGDDSGQTRLE